MTTTINTGSVWANKATGTTHMAFPYKTTAGRLGIHTTTLNLSYERDYFFRGNSINSFLKNYEWICDDEKAPEYSKYFTQVLSNKSLKRELQYKCISKEDFFKTIKDRV